MTHHYFVSPPLHRADMVPFGWLRVALAPVCPSTEEICSLRSKKKGALGKKTLRFQGQSSVLFVLQVGLGVRS